MRTRFLWALLIPFALAATGCPTRVVVTDVDAGREMPPATGGTSGSGGRGVGGAAGGGGRSDLGGQAGASLPATGGQAGAPAGGAAGSAGTGGRAGQAGSAGLGGKAGAGSPAGGAGGSDSGSSGSVVCGSVASCPLQNGGRCCYSAMDQSSACQAAGAACEAVPAGVVGTYYVKTTIACDSSSDCAAGEICCYTQFYISSSTACMAASSCVDVPAPTGGYATNRRQVCDPTKVSPTECLSGSCKPGPTYSQNLPPYLYLCL